MIQTRDLRLFFDHVVDAEAHIETARPVQDVQGLRRLHLLASKVNAAQNNKRGAKFSRSAQCSRRVGFFSLTHARRARGLIDILFQFISPSPALS